MQSKKSYQHRGTSWRNTRPHLRKSICLVPGCNRETSKNHLLQRKGVLELISDQQHHIYELRTNKFLTPQHYEFSRVGWKDAFAIHAYCCNCDTRLFNAIENSFTKNPGNDADAISYSLRPLAHEIRKKQGNMKYLASCGLSNTLHKNIAINECSITKSGISALLALHNALLTSPNEIGIKYTSRIVGFKGVAASSMLIRPMRCSAYGAEEIIEYISNSKNLSWNAVNIIPIQNGSIIFASTLAEDRQGIDFLHEIESTPEPELQITLSKMLIHQIEDWCISPEIKTQDGSAIINLVNERKHPGRVDLFYGESSINVFR